MDIPGMCQIQRMKLLGASAMTNLNTSFESVSVLDLPVLYMLNDLKFDA